MINVLGLALYGDKAASTRQRLIQYIPELAKHDINLQVYSLLNNDYLNYKFEQRSLPIKSLLRSVFARFNELIKQHKYQCIIVSSELFPLMPSLIERRLIRIPYIYDFDDAFYLKYKSNRFKMLSPFLGNKFDVVIREATKVIAGNDVIATYAQSFNKNTIILPTVVDTQRYSTKQNNNNTFTIGWLGTPSTANYLKLIFPALDKITSNKQAIVRVVGSGPINLPNINHEIIPWNENTEIELLNSFDVGIMPLFDDQWAKGKCGYKLIQYMACKIPVIASPVGINTQIINHGQNGFLASSQEEWYESFMTLIESPELRDKMGLEGRKKVEQKYSLQVTAPKFIEIIKSVVS